MVVLASFLTVALFITGTFGFSYDINASDGPNSWGGACNLPGSMAQSPIDIDRSQARHINHYLPFNFWGYDERPERMSVVNNGHSIQIEITEPRESHEMPRVREGGLPNLSYEFAQLHFHWGSTNSQGSEHTVDGWRYPMEVHLVHYNTRYGVSLGHALDNSNEEDLLAVLGVFFEIQRHHNDKLWPIINALSHVRNQGDTYFLEDDHTFRLEDLLPNTNRFYRYRGGLTTPDCDEIVMWTVFKDPIGISRDQMEEFRRLFQGNGASLAPLYDNNRPVQDLNARLVYDVNTNQYNRECRNGGLWKQDEHLSWRESREEYSFLGAIHHCIGAETRDGTHVGLMPVGQLRHFRNSFVDGPLREGDYENEFCRGRVFRVNAMKDVDGIWREYPSGNEVLFHHFPEFDPTHGKTGDSLIWDSHSDRLMIEWDESDFYALCYRRQRSCMRCQGYYDGHECNDAGDCEDYACQCDDGFDGRSCQLEPLDRFAVFVDGQVPGEMYDFSSNQVCWTDAVLPTEIEEMVSDFVFGDAYVCGAGQSGPGNGDVCYVYNWRNHEWQTISKMIDNRNGAAAEVIRVDGQDRFWMITGGRGPLFLDTSELLTEDRMWLEGPDLPEPVIRHCLVQINDCEVALIGGHRFDQGSYSNRIDIYNFETRSWRLGPSLIRGRVEHVCARIRDVRTHNQLVVIACGTALDGTGAPEPTEDVEVWDTVTGDIFVINDSPHFGGNYDCPSENFLDWADELTPYQIVMGNGNDGTSSSTEISLFTMERGFEVVADFSVGRVGSTGAVIPRGYMECGDPPGP